MVPLEMRLKTWREELFVFLDMGIDDLILNITALYRNFKF